jgi:hypothetical protein
MELESYSTIILNHRIIESLIDQLEQIWAYNCRIEQYRNKIEHINWPIFRYL